MNTRPARIDDEPALRTLAREVPLLGPVRYALEREPDFFALRSLPGEVSRTWVVESGSSGSLAAMATAVVSRRRWEGEDVPVAYFGDLRVHPDRRGQGCARRLLEAVPERLEKMGARVGFAFLLAGNRSMERFVQSSHHGPVRFHRLARVRNHFIFLGGHHRLPEGLTVRAAHSGDVGEMAALWRRCKATQSLAPCWSEEDWNAQLRHAPGLSVERVCLAFRRTCLVGMAAAWDPCGVEQMRLLGLGPHLAGLRWVQRPLAQALRRPAIPRDGEFLEALRVARLCATGPEEARAVLAGLANRHRSSGHLYLDVAFDVRDRLAHAVRGMSRTSVEFDTCVVRWDGRPTPRGVEPAWCDLAFA